MAEINLSFLPFGNGGGSIKRLDEVEEACKTPMTRITVGSITMKQRRGNIGERGDDDLYYFDERGKWSLNALGLPNLGIDAYCNLLPEMVKAAHKAKKTLWANVAGFSPNEYADMAVACFAAGVDGVELNLSCPNVWQGSAHAEMPALNPDLMFEVLQAVGRDCGGDKRLAVKLSPTPDDVLLSNLCNVIVEMQIIEQVTACNTVPNQQRKREDGREALSFRSDETDTQLKHVGGLAGSAVYETNLDMVRRLRSKLPGRIDIIHLGGIFTGKHVFKGLMAGAQGFQCTTCYLQEGGRGLVRIMSELDDELEELYG